MAVSSGGSSGGWCQIHACQMSSRHAVSQRWASTVSQRVRGGESHLRNRLLIKWMARSFSASVIHHSELIGLCISLIVQTRTIERIIACTSYRRDFVIQNTESLVQLCAYVTGHKKDRCPESTPFR